MAKVNGRPSFSENGQCNRRRGRAHDQIMEVLAEGAPVRGRRMGKEDEIDGVFRNFSALDVVAYRARPSNKHRARPENDRGSAEGRTKGFGQVSHQVRTTRPSCLQVEQVGGRAMKCVPAVRSTSSGICLRPKRRSSQGWSCGASDGQFFHGHQRPSLKTDNLRCHFAPSLQRSSWWRESQDQAGRKNSSWSNSVRQEPDDMDLLLCR